jgi:hypothetical protein
MNKSINIESYLKNFDPEKLTESVITAGEEWADEDAAASALEETRKTLLAEITLEVQAAAMVEKGAKLPISQAEIRATADPRYREHIEQMVEHRKLANRARVRYDLGKMRLELMRSVQATLRNEMFMNR